MTCKSICIQIDFSPGESQQPPTDAKPEKKSTGYICSKTQIALIDVRHLVLVVQVPLKRLRRVTMQLMLMENRRQKKKDTFSRVRNNRHRHRREYPVNNQGKAPTPKFSRLLSNRHLRPIT